MTKIPRFGSILMLVMLLGSGMFLPCILGTHAGTTAKASTVTPLATVSIGEAVDNTALTWSTGGNVAWYGQTTTYYVYGDAAQSGDISDGQTSWVSTQIQGYGKYLRFIWKVSSERDFDFLNFYMDYDLMDRISGEVNWQDKTYYIPTGWHTFEWSYIKDGSVSAGSDAGWLDYVQVISPPGPASYGDAVENTALTWYSSAANSWFGESAIYMNGGDAVQSGYIYNSENTYIATDVTGPGNLYFYWKVSSESADYLGFYIDGVGQSSISGQVDWTQETYSLTSGLHILKWQYNKDVSLTEGGDAGWLDKVEFVPTSISIGAAVDNTALTWSTGGDAHWFGQTGTAYYGGDAAQSGPITDDQATWVQTTVTGPGTLSFYWKVSSETNYDFLEFYIDSALQSSISGEVNWQQKSYSITSGSHVLQWMYSKDRSVSTGSDTAWLDQVQFTSTSTSTITVTAPNGGQNWVRGTAHTITWTYTGSPGANVKIELLKAGVLNTVISSSTANDGSYSWTISSTQTTGTNYRIRITSTSNSAITDTSNSDFTISIGALTVTAPNGGQKWVRGTTHTITWTSTGSPGANVKIELLKAGVLNRVISSSTANDGSYSWTILSTQTLGTDYKIRITSTTNSAITDSSNNNFAITAGALTVTAPNGGQTWARSSTHSITWTSTGSPGTNIKIELLKAGVLNRVISSSTANDGIYSWTISSTQTVGSDYKIRITSTSITSITDNSDSNFAIS